MRAAARPMPGSGSSAYSSSAPTSSSVRSQARASSTATTGGACSGTRFATSRVSAGSAKKCGHAALNHTGGPGSHGTRGTAERHQTLIGSTGPLHRRPTAARSSSSHASTSSFQDSRNQSTRRGGGGADHRRSRRPLAEPSGQARPPQPRRARSRPGRSPSVRRQVAVDVGEDVAVPQQDTQLLIGCGHRDSSFW